MANYIPNMPAPERGHDYTGPTFPSWSGGTTGYQPEGPNNPAGNVGSIPVMSIKAETWEMLSGPQPG
jgi:hypothetical protein